MQLLTAAMALYISVVRGISQDDNTTVASDATTSKTSLPRVHVVTEADVSSNTYTIADVVMPLPGLSVEYPQHAAGTSSYHFPP
jgi:hypothetical protein